MNIEDIRRNLQLGGGSNLKFPFLKKKSSSNISTFSDNSNNIAVYSDESSASTSGDTTVADDATGLTRPQLIHLHSSEFGKTPVSSQLRRGEIAINDAHGQEFLIIKNDKNEIKDFKQPFIITANSGISINYAIFGYDASEMLEVYERIGPGSISFAESIASGVACISNGVMSSAYGNGSFASGYLSISDGFYYQGAIGTGNEGFANNYEAISNSLGYMTASLSYGSLAAGYGVPINNSPKLDDATISGSTIIAALSSYTSTNLEELKNMPLLFGVDEQFYPCALVYKGIDDGKKNVLFNAYTRNPDGFSNKIGAFIGGYASGVGSISLGLSTIAQNDGEVALGCGNFSHNNTLFTIGNSKILTAKDDDIPMRTNAVEVMMNGDMYVSGIGNYDGRTLADETNNIKTLQTVIKDLTEQINTLKTQVSNLTTELSNCLKKGEAIDSGTY